MSALPEPPAGQREQEAAAYTRDVLASVLPKTYRVHQGANLLYRIEIAPSGKTSNHGQSAPSRGRYAFQTDILVTRADTPLVVVELKAGSFSTHDVITYSWKAQRHKQVYPYLRYGFAVVGVETPGPRFVTHNEAFDFAVALPVRADIGKDLVAFVRRQIASAEQIIELTRKSRVRLRRFEQSLEIEA